LNADVPFLEVAPPVYRIRGNGIYECGKHVHKKWWRS
jgi:hypothetical protein